MQTNNVLSELGSLIVRLTTALSLVDGYHRFITAITLKMNWEF
jgi:hypothetical protein